ncbi:MAG: hypothetical protein BWY94_01928 [Actinobacteria bacterium ADurb.BinA094]|nr:MAG: hypothetical protein BWY94_01928 [Actinobacteria bacterium ADurb.BinA094]
MSTRTPHRRAGHYRLPTAAASEDDDLRLANADLPRMSDAELLRELEHVRTALGIARREQLERVRFDYPDTWTGFGYLTSRERAINSILRTRVRS